MGATHYRIRTVRHDPPTQVQAAPKFRRMAPAVQAERKNLLNHALPSAMCARPRFYVEFSSDKMSFQVFET